MATAANRLDQRPDRAAVTACLIWIAAVLCLFAVARVLRPGAQQALMISGLELSLPQLCSFRALLGVDCPGCGLTRCFVLAARLRLADAWAMHPIGTLLASYLAMTIPQRLWRLTRLLTAAPTRSTLRWELLLIAALVAAAYARWMALSLGLLQRLRVSRGCAAAVDKTVPAFGPAERSRIRSV